MASSYIIDVTPIFLPLIRDITTLTYDQLKTTPAFLEMRRYVDIPHHQEYTLTICKHTLFFENSKEIQAFPGLFQLDMGCKQYTLIN